VTNLRDAGINLSILLDLMNLGDMSRKLRGVYDAQLTRVNAAIARLLTELRKEPGSADTLLIVSADHGEEFHEHGGFFHGGTLYQEAIHVPLIVHGQTFPAARIAAPVALYRLPATILDWFGFKGSSVESVSLRAGARVTLPVFASSNSLGRKPPSFALIDYPLKLIYERAGSLEELYDLIEDPGEQRNRGEDPTLSERRKEMERALDRIMFHFEYGPERVQSLRQRDETK
jgi:arylsulfatase A-like enzyme